jgi:hypothetical protein
MRNVFIASGRDASVGTYAFGFSWGAWAALLIATVLFCAGMRASKGGGGIGRNQSGRSNRSRRSTRSRPSYDLAGRRVKDEYP